MHNESLPQLIEGLAGHFIARLQAQAGCESLPAPELPARAADLVWRNSLFRAPGFRRAHVELFEIPQRFAVVHLCVLPHTYSAAPIFGFDMISGHAQATGLFLDFSPVVGSEHAPAMADVITSHIRCEFKVPRAKPAWGSVFSDDFFAIRPADRDEIDTALALVSAALEHFLSYLPTKASGLPPDESVLQGQSAYARAQRQNPHTFRMLANYVGKRAARKFIDEVLFPLPV